MGWRYRDTVLVLCMLAFFVTFFGRVVISPVVPFIRDDFGVSNTQIGIALSGMWVAYGISQFPSGVLADRYGEKPIILVAVGGTAITSLLAAFAPVFMAFAACVFLLGAVAGLHYSVASTLLSRIYDDIGTALGVHTFGAPLAGLTAPVAAAWVGVNYGWRPAVALSVLVAAPVYVLFSWRVRPTEPRKPDQSMRSQFELEALYAYLERPPILFTVVIAIITTFVMNGLNTFLPTFLIEHRGQSATLAGAVFAGFYIIRGGAQIGIGAFSDRYGRDLGISICLVSGIVGLTVFVVGPTLVSVAVATLLVGVGAGFFSALEPRFMDLLGEEERTAGFGLVRTIFVVIGATGSIGVGLFADLFGWGNAFIILGALFAVALATIAVNWAFGLGY